LRLCLKLRQRLAFGILFSRDGFPKAPMLGRGGLWRVWAEPGRAC